MKILYMSPSAELGGAERCLLDMLVVVQQCLPDAVLHVLVMAEGPLVSKIRQLGVGVSVVPLPPGLALLGDSGLSLSGSWRDAGLRGLVLGRRSLGAFFSLWGYLGRLGRCVQEVTPDLVHANGLKAHVLAALVAPPIPVVWHIHDFVGGRRLVRYGLRGLAFRVRWAIANSHAVAEDFRRTIPGLPVTVVYNAVDGEIFAPLSQLWLNGESNNGPNGEPNNGLENGLKNVLDDWAGLPMAAPGTVRVGLVAAFARWKGQDVFLEAAAQVLRVVTVPVRFYVVGGAIYATEGSQFSLEELRRRAEELGIGDGVGFTGFVDGVERAYQALDIVVHASTRPEPFGRTVVEAMACGKAVVVSLSGGVVELFRPNEEAVGFACGDPQSLAQVLVALIGDPDWRFRLEIKGRQAVLKRFSYQELGDRLSQIYSQVHEHTADEQ